MLKKALEKSLKKPKTLERGKIKKRLGLKRDKKQRKTFIVAQCKIT